jgi:hypothetical protein
MEQPTVTPKQRELAAHQVSEFYHDQFVTAQVADFRKLFDGSRLRSAKALDIGGGVGYFARAARDQLELDCTVLDMDAQSIARAAAVGVKAELGDALTTRLGDDAPVACFNLILHHLVSGRWHTTLALQKQALANQLEGPADKQLFVNEYVFESYAWQEFASRLIFAVTSSRVLSAVGRAVARFIPSLRANTFGVGVCFHTDRTWRGLFEQAGWRVEQVIEGELEEISVPRRAVLLLRRYRRNSYRLARAPGWILRRKPSV